MRELAIRLNVSMERIDKFEQLGLMGHQFKIFMDFDDGLLDRLIALGLDADELYLVVQDHCDSTYLNAYAQLREHGLTAEELRPIRYPVDFLLGVEQGIPHPVLKRADKKDIRAQNLIDGKNAHISFGDMFEAAATRNVATLYVYIQRRQEGYAHKQLMQVLKLADPDERDFDLADYRTVRLAGIAHDDVVKMLRKLRKPEQRSCYYDYVTTNPGRDHSEALALALRGVNRELYLQLADDLSYQQIIDGLDRGLSMRALMDCVDFNKSNVRISFEEIIECYCTMGNLGHIISYIRWIDEGFTYKQIDEVHKLGQSMTVYSLLREKSLELSHEDIMAIFDRNIDPWRYMKLRNEDMEHEAAMQSVVESQT